MSIIYSFSITIIRDSPFSLFSHTEFTQNDFPSLKEYKVKANWSLYISQAKQNLYITKLTVYGIRSTQEINS